MNPVEQLVKWYIKSGIKDIYEYRNFAVQMQKKTFDYLIKKAKDTKFGKEHNFASIRSVKDFQRYVPVTDYDGIKDLVQLMMEGQQNILWPTKITWFAKSSGTTSDKSKFIPVSQETLDNNHFKGGQDVMCMYANNLPNTKIFSGKILIMGGSQTVHPLNKETHFGDVSAVMMSNTPAIANYLRAPKRSIALMGEWEEKLQRMAESTLKENITGIAGVPTWTVVLINKLFEMTGKTDLREIWPNFELYIHGGVSFVPYKENFRKLIPHADMNYIQTYNASEGFFSFQDILGADDMLLATNHGIFFEFLPSEEWDKAHPEALTIQEVEVGKNYAIVISTNSGLWRYKLGDTVTFTSKDPYRIKVSGRTKHFINAFGEEVIVDNSDQAINEACRQTLAEVADYTVAPIFFSEGEQASHEWLIEFNKAPHDIDAFMNILDKTLQNLNSDYEAKRYKDIALKSPKLNIAKSGLFNDWLKQRGKLGGQNKVPRLSNDRKYIEELLKINLTVI